MKDDNKENLEDLFNKATSEGKSSSETQKALSSKKGKSKYMPYIIGLFSVAILGTGAYFVMQQDGNENPDKGAQVIDKDDKLDSSHGSNDEGAPDERTDLLDGEVAITDDMTEEERKEANENNDSLYGKEGNRDNELEEWGKGPYYDLSKEELDKAMVEYSQSTSVTNSTGGLASREAGFTDDTNNSTNADGTLNDKYSYQLKENLERDFGLYTQRLINPVFGGWNFASWGHGEGIFEGGLRPELFEDMFTRDWWSANINNKGLKNVPIYGDWAGDAWGLGKDAYDLNTLAPWQGKVVSVYSYTEPVEGNAGMALYTESGIEFTAIMKDGSKKVRNGTLKLKLIPNLENERSERRNLIDGASLVVTP